MSDQSASAEMLLRALRDFASAAREASLSGLVALKLSETDVKAMRLLLAHPGSLPRDIARELGISSASTTVLMDRLEKRGLLRREPSPTDRRSLHVYATVSAADEPWSSLDDFDRRAADIASRWPEEVIAQATEVIVAMTQITEPV